MSPEEQRNAALQQIKDVVADGVAEINDRSYKFGVMTFTERRTVFAYMSSVESRIQSGDISFIDEPKFKEVEKVIYRNVTVDDMSLSKKNVFEDHPEDYIIFVTTALMVISYPFLKGQLGG